MLNVRRSMESSDCIYNRQMPDFTPAQQRAVESLARDLEHVFKSRVESLVVYAGHQGDGSVHSCAVVDGLAFRDLTACLPMTESWHRRGVAVPLLLSSDELRRTVDIFPLEYASIVADHVLVRGRDPFASLTIPVEDLRRAGGGAAQRQLQDLRPACEALAKSHLIHLREGFLETHGETTRVARVIAASAAPLRALLTHISRLPDQGARGAETFTPTDASLAKLARMRMGVPEAIIREVLASSSDG